MKAKAAIPPRNEWLWLLVGIVLAVGWFAMNRSLPPLFRGDICCDSASYVNMAGSEKIDGAVVSPSSGTISAPINAVRRIIGLLFDDTGYRTIGYPAFLAAHRLAFEWTGLSPMFSWITASMLTALLLHILSSWFFYRSVRSLGIPVHPAALMLIVAHPLLTSHAALPLSDSLATSVLLIAIGMLMRTWKRGPWPTVLTGFLFALVLWIRPAHLLPLLGTLALWCGAAMVMRKKKGIGWMLPLAAVLIFGVSLSPRLWSCSVKNGTLCFMPPAEKAVQETLLFRLGLKSARTYTVLWSGNMTERIVAKDVDTTHVFDPGKERAAILSVPDPFLMKFFGSCPVNEERPTGDLLLCLTRGWNHLPVFFLKKTIGLFDAPHWNTYATYVTPPWILGINRIFGTAGFVGFGALIAMASAMVMRKKKLERQQWIMLVTLGVPLLSLGTMSLVAIESRYGMPLVPFGMLGAVLLAQSLSQRKRGGNLLVLAACLAALTFLLQTHQWDYLDPFPWIPLEQAL